MKRLVALVLALICVLNLVGCVKQSPECTNTIEGNVKTYNEMSDGTWECDGQIYKYRLEIKGTIPNAAASSTFVFLSNIKNIPFDRAWKAAGYSSNTADYFAVEDAVIVEIKTD